MTCDKNNICDGKDKETFFLSVALAAQHAYSLFGDDVR